MEACFASLTRRQTMLLLTAMTFGGQESLGIFDHLPDDEGELLRHRAEEILKIPREKRIPLLVQEIKRLVTARRGKVAMADPERVAQVLAKERPALVEVLLRALPAGTAEAVRMKMPQMPRVKLSRDVKPEILNIVRWRLEEALAAGASRRPGFKFSDLLLLKSRELVTVADRLGARALAQAIAALPEPERVAFLEKLRPDQRQVAQKVVAAAISRALLEEDGRQLLALHGAEVDPAEAIRSAGAQRLARAALAQSPEFATRLVERNPGPFGQLLSKWMREERSRVTGRVDGGRTDVVTELERLEQKGIIEKPIRLAPPPKLSAPKLPAVHVPAPKPSASTPSTSTRPSQERGRSELPGGKVLVPRPRSAPERHPSERRPSERAALAPPSAASPYRDPIAERQARRAGIPVPLRAEESAERDPIAQRDARRAGAVPSTVPVRRSVPDKTSIARPRKPGGRGGTRGG